MNNSKIYFLFITFILILLFGATAISAVDENTTQTPTNDIVSQDLSENITSNNIEKIIKENKVETQTKENKKISKNNTNIQKKSENNYIYVSSKGNTNNDGLDRTTPTTIEKALTNIYNNSVIYFITNTNEDTYYFKTPLNVTTAENNITFTLKGEENKKIIFNGGNETGFLKFKDEGNNITISNIEFRNSKTDCLIFAHNNNLKLDNLTFTENTLEIEDMSKMTELATILDLSYSNILINNTIFKGNFAQNLSSLIVVRNSSNFILNNSVFENNHGVDFSRGIFSKSSYLIIENNTFRYNYFDDQNIMVISYSKIDITSTKFYNNSIKEDGCINIILSEVNFKNSEFTDNKAKNGGVLFIQDSGCNIINSTFSRNNATSSGGAIVFLSGELNIKNSIFKQNTAKYEGGAINLRQADVNILNSTFTDNKATNGGALYITYNDNSSFAQIHSSIFKNNNATSGSVVYSSDYINLTYNTLFSDNLTNMFYSIYNRNYDINNNWWGSNNPNFKILTNNILPKNWITLKISNKTLTNNTQQITIKLQKENPQEVMAECEVNFITNTGNFAQKTMKIKDTITNYYNGNINDCIIKLDHEKINITQKADLGIYVNNITCNPGENININIFINNDTTANTTVKFDNTIIYEGKIKNGILNLTYKIDPKYALSTHNLTIIYPGDNLYKTKTLINKINVRINETKQNTTITPQDNTNTTINTSNSSLPSKYDLRDFNQVTSVKDQGSDGNCWSFSAIAVVESAILKKYNITYDFSENNMKNIMNKYSFMGNPFKEPNQGDSSFVSMGYLLGWFGPINDTEDPYVSDSLISPTLNSTIHIQDIVFADDINQIKKLIMNIGGASSLIFAGKDPLNLYNIVEDEDHAITLIGWDDNYSRYNFKAKDENGNIVNPPGDGAFILKNSWGTDIGDNGYQYISFYDKTFSDHAFAYTVILDDTKKYENIYQYDTVIYVDSMKEDSKKAYKNVYTAKRNETISAVGIYSEKGTNYTIEIYVNNVLKMTQNGNLNYDGFKTIKLNNYIPVIKDDIFTVVIKTTSKTPSGAWIQNPVYKSSNKENQSFIKFGDEEWIDLYDSSTAAPVKVYTKTTPTITTHVNPTDDQLIIEANITTQTPGKLIFKANGVTLKDKQGNVIIYNINSNKSIKLAYDLKYNKKQLNFTTVFTTVDYKIVQQKDIQITTKDIIMQIDPIHGYVGDEIQLNVTITDINKNNITGGKVAFKANGVTLKDEKGNVLYAKLINGKASITYKIPSSWKNPIITCTFSGTGRYVDGRINTTDVDINITAKITPIPAARNNETITITTTLSDTTINSGRAVYKINGVTIKDEKGNPKYLSVKNGVITLKYTIPENFSNKKYTITFVFSNKNYSNITINETLTIKKSETKQIKNINTTNKLIKTEKRTLIKPN